jgi:trans-2,3-dihydro-3-hydroxyanthranilate isomerase
VWFGRVTPGEDPVTGSAAGCLACYLVNEGVLLAAPTAEVRIEQGVEVKRRGVVEAFVDVDGKKITRVRVGGRAVLMGEGELRF